MSETAPPENPQSAAVSGEGEVDIASERIADAFDKLPAHARKLLKIRVPLQVTLATQRMSIQEITELGPGSIIQFEKTCDEPIELSVAERPLARGEVVKVGDKFGLRINELSRLSPAV